MIPRAQISAILLAGGRGRRMGGADKGLLPFQGRPLISHVIAAVGPQVGTLLLSVNRHGERYAALGYPLVFDHDENFAGPLAGIAGGLARLTTPYALVVPCDMPYLPLNLVERLMEPLASGDAQAAIAQGAGRLQPLCTLLKCDIEQDLRDYKETGGAKVEQWLRRLRHVVVDFSDQPAAFCNVNTPEDLAIAEAIQSSSMHQRSQPMAV